MKIKVFIVTWQDSVALNKNLETLFQIFERSLDGIDLHINIIRGNLTDEQWHVELKNGIREIFELTVQLGGTLSGEHGIGYVQKEYMDIKYPAAHINLMKGIKAVFDPNYILNPGKIFN